VNGEQTGRHASDGVDRGIRGRLTVVSHRLSGHHPGKPWNLAEQEAPRATVAPQGGHRAYTRRQRGAGFRTGGTPCVNDGHRDPCDSASKFLVADRTHGSKCLRFRGMPPTLPWGPQT
jgi:hypothetical protein